MTPREVLLAAADLIEKGGLSKHAYGRTSEGVAVLADDPRAVSFCLMGALDRVGLDPDPIAAIAADRFIRDEVARRTGHRGLIGFSDDPSTTQAEVVAALRAAAAKAEDQQAAQERSE